MTEETYNKIKKIVNYRLNDYKHLRQFEEDIVQDVALRITRSNPQFENEEHRFRYIHKVTRRVIVMYDYNGGGEDRHKLEVYATPIEKNEEYVIQIEDNSLSLDDKFNDDHQDWMVNQILTHLDNTEQIILNYMIECITLTEMALRLKENGIKSQKGTWYTKQGVSLKVEKIKTIIKKLMEK